MELYKQIELVKVQRKITRYMLAIQVEKDKGTFDNSEANEQELFSLLMNNPNFLAVFKEKFDKNFPKAKNEWTKASW